MNAYKSGCVDCLKKILDQWNEKYNADSDIPDSLLDLYSVYQELYSPWDLGRISNSEFGDKIYEGISYYLIQEKITYDYYFKSYGDEYWTLEQFRPAISNDAIKTLYLDEDYGSAINCFLGAKNLFFDLENDETVVYLEDTNERYMFLQNFLMFFQGHWGYYWHMETHPEVLRILFNADMDSAQVEFRLGYQGGEVILGKENLEWSIVDHYMT